MNFSIKNLAFICTTICTINHSISFHLAVISRLIRREQSSKSCKQFTMSITDLLCHDLINSLLLLCINLYLFIHSLVLHLCLLSRLLLHQLNLPSSHLLFLLPLISLRLHHRFNLTLRLHVSELSD